MNTIAYAKQLPLMLLCLVLASLPAIAGEFNEVLSIGDEAPAWEKLPGTDGKQHSLADLKDQAAVVVVFTCASCPTAVDYEARISALAEKYAEKSVAVVAICVNQVKQDKLDALTERVKKQKLGFHYLQDESQQIAKDYGAILTPEFFVLDRDRKIVYMGAMDDRSNADEVTEKWVEQALDATLAGQPVATQETVGRGCLMRWAKQRRS